WHVLVETIYKGGFTMSKGAEFNWNEIERLLEEAEPFVNEYGDVVRMVYLGTVFQLTPSGKYYTFWTGTEEDFEMDSAWWERVEAEAEERGLFFTSGEGDPCDIYICRIEDTEEEE